MKGEVALTGDFSVGLDHLVEAGDFAGDDDVVFRETKVYGGLGAGNGAFDKGLALDCITRDGVGPAGVIIHLLCKKVGIQASGVDTDADGLIKVTGDFDEGPEVIVVAKAAPTLPGLILNLARVRAQSGWLRRSRWPMKWKSPIMGTWQPISSRRSRMRGTAAAAASLLTVTRTSSLPESTGA